MRWVALVVACLVLAGCASPPPPSSPPDRSSEHPPRLPLAPGFGIHQEATVVDDGLVASRAHLLWLNGTAVLAVGNESFPYGRLLVRDNVTVLHHHNGSEEGSAPSNGSEPRHIWHPANQSASQPQGEPGHAWFLVDPPQPLTGHPVRFTAVVSSGSPVTSYDWSFGLGGERKAGNEVTHVFRTPGPHTVLLTVRTEAGHMLGASTSLQVLAEEEVLGFTVAPVLLLQTGGQRVLLAGVGDALQFEATGREAGASLAWSFGDGATATGPTASHAYAAVGNYSIDLTATRPDGSSFAVQKRIQVRNELPIVDFRPEPRWESGLRVVDASAWDPDGRIVSYRWDVDNRTVSLEPRLLLEAGRHWVTLTVTDEDGATASRSAIVEA